jgi:hypothetical protein
MLRCMNTLSLCRRVCRSDHVSHPQRSRFMGMAQNRRYLIYVSRCRLHQISLSAPIDALAAAIRPAISSLLYRLNEIREPRYLNKRVKVT